MAFRRFLLVSGIGQGLDLRIDLQTNPEVGLHPSQAHVFFVVADAA